MNKLRYILQSAGIAVALSVAASAAHAQATRTWVSGVGDDANPCSRTAPCKTFAGAISKTATGGEISVLDPGGFGAVTITKSLTIDGGAFQASILACGTNGVIINDVNSVAPRTAIVTLRNLAINGCRFTTGPGLNGIRFLSGKELNVINTFINGFSTNGIDVQLNQNVAAKVHVEDTTVKQVAGAGMLIVNAQAAEIRTLIVRSSFVENGTGLHARSHSRVVARNSVFSLNTGTGVFADAITAGTAATVSLWENQISLNGQRGVQAGGNLGTSTATIALNQIDRNVAAGVFIAAGGVVETFTNNSIRGNGGDGCGGCASVGPGN